MDPSFVSVLIVMDEANPTNPPLVISQRVSGDTVETDPAIEVINSLIMDGFIIIGVGNFQIGAGVYQNILLASYF